MNQENGLMRCTENCFWDGPSVAAVSNQKYKVEMISNRFQFWNFVAQLLTSLTCICNRKRVFYVRRLISDNISLVIAPKDVSPKVSLRSVGVL